MPAGSARFSGKCTSRAHWRGRRRGVAGEPVDSCERPSSMASRGVFTHGGVIGPSPYPGEIVVLMMTLTEVYEIRSGDRIAQLVPTPVLTGRG